MTEDCMNDLLIKLQQAAVTYSITGEYTPIPNMPTVSRPLPYAIIEPVLAAINLTPDVFALTRLRQISLGSTNNQPLYEMLLASALVRRTHVLGDAKHAVQELLNLVMTNKAYSRIVMVLAGAEILCAAELAPGISIIPFKDLKPPSWIKEFQEESSWPLSRTFEHIAPSAALVMQHLISPVFTSENEPNNNFPLSQIAQLRTMAYCIALTAGHSPAILRVWLENDDPRLPIVSSEVVYANPRWAKGRATSYDVDSERVSSVYASYLNFQGDRRPLDIAMSRLTDALGGWEREERAIDVGITLEVLLTHTQGGQRGQNTEIRYKLGVHAGWLIGVDSADRIFICRKIRRLYNFRSQAAHSGVVKTRSDTWAEIDDEIETGIALGGRIVIAILKLGAWPKWDELVFGTAP